MRALFAIPGDLATLTGGYGYDREILAHAAAHGVELTHAALPARFPAPTPDDFARTAELFRQARERVVLIDGLALGAFTPELLRAIPQRIVALVHHPLALENGLAPERAEELRASERAALAGVRAIVTPSAATRDVLCADYGVAPERVAIAEPGTTRAQRAVADGDPPRLLAVGSIVPRKGYDVLIDALARIAHLPWTMTIVGSPDRARDHAAAVRAQAAALGPRLRFAGEMPFADLDALYAQSDLFVLASHYEGYGMVLGEAMARGLPIVTTRAGAAATTAPDAAALKVAPGDAAALAQALARAIADAPLRRRLAEASWRAGQALPSWDDAARIIAAVLRRVNEERE